MVRSSDDGARALQRDGHVLLHAGVSGRASSPYVSTPFPCRNLRIAAPPVYLSRRRLNKSERTWDRETSRRQARHHSHRGLRRRRRSAQPRDRRSAERSPRCDADRSPHLARPKPVAGNPHPRRPAGRGTPHSTASRCNMAGIYVAPPDHHIVVEERRRSRRAHGV